MASKGYDKAAVKKGVSLAEFRSGWMEKVVGAMDTHFTLKFGPPQVHAICEEEVTLIFNIEEIKFYSTKACEG